ncbi:Arc family DNA-binding protein [Lachnoclostridium sp. An169]|uniref:Arc family DNA-binding protein n=1 Tax=Lachnoclostridium sp. An169 TaxID=1965569 RepID=UPI0011227539|nr:Arc family DNA-binding protein [Lachnoclostridium sp. An169]
MPSDTAKFTLRTDPELLKKFRYVAEYNARSANRELEVLMKRHVAKFEKEHGKINTEL